ncbi:hypothetical protein MB901379_02863 [Mycobacterium basiliense]|uniref:Integral membrane protein n=1 Tax=Mycobacterium basiliense TaxID=2094119 RepID=A0A447GFL5_9MYCO|nr:hypothetical protein [Mycobacterium basiliense]VDM89290.1 hypothetical protein MB901379_02863 [Mycobacterium basiliense]
MNPSFHRSPARRESSSAAAESWFLARGLPAVLTTRARWRRLWPRSAPVLAAYATLHCWTLPILLITHGDEVVIDGQPTPREWMLLALVAIAPVLITFVGWLVSRLSDSRKRSLAATVAVSVVAIVLVVETSVTQMPDAAVFAVVVLLLTGTGVGSVVGWSARMTLSHLATIGALAVRALPVVLLTTLVFFNSNIWLMASTISAERLGLAMVFLFGIASAFVVSATQERVGPILQSPAVLAKDCQELADTPFAAMSDPPESRPLTWAERVNVVFVLAAHQLVQIMVVAILTAAIYVTLGLIVLSPALLKEWSHNASGSTTVLDLTVPVPDSLIHLCLFLGALTFMYISARAVGDAEYRATFVDPLIDDLHVTLIARDRYRYNVAGQTVDASPGSD